MKYRSEIDGLRALAVVPVILFHADFSAFGGGFVGVDVFFVISGYLITTILMEDIQNGRFSIVKFYERRARRILPALFMMLTASTICAYVLLYPSDLEEYSNSLIWTLGFVSNIFFRHNSEYFATEAELVPLLHTWSLAVEEQYYVIFPVFLFAFWRLGKIRVFWIIVVVAALSLILSEVGWRNSPNANFYLAPTRVWEILAGSISAFMLQKNRFRKNEWAALLGLIAIIASIFFFDESTPFPSVFALIPVLGAVLIVVFAQSDTIVGKFLGAKVFVAIGLISYSAYLWHQPLLAFYRRENGVELDLTEAFTLVALTVVLAGISWRFIEIPFRTKKSLTRKTYFYGIGCAATLISSASFLVYTNGASFRFDFPAKPLPWDYVSCHGPERISEYPDPLKACLGHGDESRGGDLYLIGDSHAAQLTFVLKSIAKERGVSFNFISTEDRGDYPYSFWRDEITEDRLLNYVLSHGSGGDIFLTSFHRGHLNESRDAHLKRSRAVDMSEKEVTYLDNMKGYLQRFHDKGFSVYLIKDGPLLSDADTTLEGCMLQFMEGKEVACPVSLEQDQHTRYRQNYVFDALAEKFSNVHTLDYLPVLYNEKVFSPISGSGEYLMFDRHHLTEIASMKLLGFFQKALYP